MMYDGCARRLLHKSISSAESVGFLLFWLSVFQTTIQYGNWILWCFVESIKSLQFSRTIDSVAMLAVLNSIKLQLQLTVVFEAS